MTNPILLALDVDGVLADLMSPWLALYNAEWDDHLTLADITAWNVDRFVRPECGMHVYEYLITPGLYENVAPLESPETVSALRAAGFRVIFVTSAWPGTAGFKQRWLSEHGFLLNHHDYVECSDKNLIRAPFLIDDRLDTCLHYPALAILRKQPWNHSADVPRRITQVENLSEVLRMAPLMRLAAESL